MISIDGMTDEDFERHSLAILQRELGLDGLARFLRLNRSTDGDYTRNRHKWLDGLTIDEITTEVQSRGQPSARPAISQVDQLVSHIRKTLPAMELLVPSADESYRSLPLCVIDAVYSIGVRYESTERTVDDFCRWSCWSYTEEHSVGEFLDLMEPYAGRWDALAVEVFRNRQRTSSRSGVLKAEAVYRFSQELRRSGVETLKDVSKVGSDRRLRSAITDIPGQGSGISLKYFMMLAGFEGVVKPDRMISRFVADALGVDSVGTDLAEALVLSAHRLLHTENPRLTASMLDYGIWTYQRNARGTMRR
ncbi:MAG TPA: hypothetical protein VG273_25025 [Bryobacteraceae bacterium]|jgi:hypothetical protein|nr:hypothetical protein [Bryobacteraceae bacterium]